MDLSRFHCLPVRVQAIVDVLDADSGAKVRSMVEDGCRCPGRQTCDLGAACESIHRAFGPHVGRA